MVAPNYGSKANSVASFETLQNNDDVNRNLEADLCLTLTGLSLTDIAITVNQSVELTVLNKNILEVLKPSCRIIEQFHSVNWWFPSLFN